MRKRPLWLGLLIIAALLVGACSLSGIAGTPVPSAEPQIPSTPTPGITQTDVVPPTATAVAPTQTPMVPPTATAVAPTQTPMVLPTDTADAPTQAPAATKTMPAGVAVQVQDIHMLNPSMGWAVGTYPNVNQAILRTSDGGVTWKVFSPPEANPNNLKAVAFFLNEKTAWVTYAASPGSPSANSPKVWRTSDGGLSWKNSELDVSNMTTEYTATGQVGFFDENHGWLLMHLGAGMMHDYVAIYTTSNAGESWKRVVDPGTSNLPMSCYKSAVWFRDVLHGYVAGNCGGVQAGLFFYQTSDGGATWEVVHLADPAGSAGIYSREGVNNEADMLKFSTAQQGSVFVASTDLNQGQNKSRRWVYATADGGATWNSKALPGFWGEGSMLDANLGWYLMSKDRETQAGTQIYKTLDGGKTWKMLATVNWQGPVQFVDANNGWVIAHNGDAQDLVVTHNGGVSWDLLKTLLIP